MKLYLSVFVSSKIVKRDSIKCNNNTYTDYSIKILILWQIVYTFRLEIERQTNNKLMITRIKWRIHLKTNIIVEYLREYNTWVSYISTYSV